MALKVHLIYYGAENIDGNKREIADRLAAGLGKLKTAIENQNIEFIPHEDFDENALDTTWFTLSLVSMGPGHQPSAQFNIAALIKFKIAETDLGDGTPT